MTDTGQTRFRDSFAGRLARSITVKVPRDHREADEMFARRRRVVAAFSLAGAGMLGLSLSKRPGSPTFYLGTLGVACTWTAGGFASGPLHLGWLQDEDHTLRRPVTTPIATGCCAFAAFYAGALVARHIPLLDNALRRILRFADQGSTPLVLLTTLANGAAEEVFFRGAVYAAVGERRPVAVSTAVYAVATAATGNPALVLAGGVMGTLFGLQRRASGGIQAPMITHLTWSALMLRYIPPLFRPGQGVT
jgi:membrane protease YdiL (CAAX protease family)